MAGKLKIAFVSNRSWDLKNFRGGVYNKLQEMGYEIFLIAPYDNFSHTLKAENVDCFHFYMSNYSVNPFHEVRSLYNLYNIYRKIRPDFIFHYSIKPNVYGTLAASRLKIPSVSVITGLGLFADNKNKIIRKISHGLYRLVVKFANEIWFLNRTDKDYFTDKIKVPSHKTDVLPGEGINTARFNLCINNSSEKKIRFLYAGRLVWAKGLRELAEAAVIVKEKYPDAVFQLLGFIELFNPDGIPRDQVNRWQEEGTFEYLGETYDIVPFLQHTDCVVLPSYREGMSRILLEASSMGITVIASDVVGCREIVEHGVTGFLCEPKNSIDLADKLCDFLRLSIDERQKMGLLRREKVIKTFDEKLVVEHYKEVLRKYLGAKKDVQIVQDCSN